MSLLCGLPSFTLLVRYTDARKISENIKSDYLTPLIKTLQWPPVSLMMRCPSPLSSHHYLLPPSLTLFQAQGTLSLPETSYPSMSPSLTLSPALSLCAIVTFAKRSIPTTFLLQMRNQSLPLPQFPFPHSLFVFFIALIS